MAADGTFIIGNVVPNYGLGQVYALVYSAPGAGSRTAMLGTTDSDFTDGLQFEKIAAERPDLIDGHLTGGALGEAHGRRAALDPALVHIVDQGADGAPALLQSHRK